MYQLVCGLGCANKRKGTVIINSCQKVILAIGVTAKTTHFLALRIKLATKTINSLNKKILTIFINKKTSFPKRLAQYTVKDR